MKIHRRILAAMTALALAAGMLLCSACSNSLYTALDAKSYWDSIEDTPLEDFEYEFDGWAYNLLRYKGDDEIVKIPAKINGSRVILGSDAADAKGVFEDNTVIKKVYTSAYISIYNHSTFKNCSSLCEVFFSKEYSFMNIYETHFAQNFEGCNSLSTILIDEAHPRYMAKDGIIYSKTGLNDIIAAECCVINSKRIVLPEYATVIARYAFSGCRFLESITISPSVKNIEEGAFSECENLSSVTIPEGVETIQAGAFADCPKLTEISLPSSIKKLEPISGENDDLVINYNGKSYSAKTDRNALIEAIRANNPNG